MAACNFGLQEMCSSAEICTLLTGGLLAVVPAAFTAWITSRLTSSREHKRCVLDNKKQEWRELVDTMHECMDRMAKDLSSGAEASIHQGYRILRNRIFIADVVTHEQITKGWKSLVDYALTAQLPPDPSAHGGQTLVGFNNLAAPFEDKLMELARHDLLLPPLPPEA
ncbi:MAG: hypothetical protein WBE41_17940 [Terracidiphilus sp.]